MLSFSLIGSGSVSQGIWNLRGAFKFHSRCSFAHSQDKIDSLWLLLGILWIPISTFSLFLSLSLLFLIHYMPYVLTLRESRVPFVRKLRPACQSENTIRFFHFFPPPFDISSFLLSPFFLFSMRDELACSKGIDIKLSLLSDRWNLKCCLGTDYASLYWL